MEKNNIKIAPSILAGDFGHLADEAKRIEESGADYLHIDVMDGHFVPNLTFGSRAVAAINRATDMFLDVHIMVYNPFDYIEELVASGADQITFHLEATEDVEDVISYIKKANVKVGLAFKPETTESLIVKYLDKIDTLLLMTVNPGFGGQEFMPEVLEKVRFARQTCEKLDIQRDIQVDGGINEETAKLAIEAGANVLVAGTYVFNFENLADGVNALRKQGS